MQISLKTLPEIKMTNIHSLIARPENRFSSKRKVKLG